MSVDGELRIRDFENEDQAAVEGLFLRVIGRDFPAKRFAWLFRDNPLGRGVCPLALLGDELVGSTASIAIPFRHPGGRLDIFRLQDALVDESCRGQGIYTKLMKESSRIFDERGVSFVFGFPNENSKWLFLNRGGYTLVDEIPTLGLELAANGGILDSGLEFEPAGPGSFTEADARLFAGMWRDVPLYTERTLEYLRLRYAPEVGHRYHVVRGFAGGELRVLAVGKFFEPAAAIDVMELVGPPDPGVLRATMDVLATAVGDRRVERFETWIRGANPLVAAAREAGFAPSGRTTNLIWRCRPDGGLPAPAVDDLLITMGDSDVY